MKKIMFFACMMASAMMANAQEVVEYQQWKEKQL